MRVEKLLEEVEYALNNLNYNIEEPIKVFDDALINDLNLLEVSKKIKPFDF